MGIVKLILVDRSELYTELNPSFKSQLPALDLRLDPFPDSQPDAQMVG